MPKRMSLMSTALSPVGRSWVLPLVREHYRVCKATPPYPIAWIEKAAEGWLGNNPLNPSISIVRLWGYCLLPIQGATRAVVKGADPARG